MNVTSVKLYEPKKQSALKAYGTVTMDGVLDLKLSIIDTGTGPFITWKGTEAYQDKDGVKKYASPIFFSDKAVDDLVKDEVIKKYRSQTASRANSAPTNDSSFTYDDIPF